ncbi:MAG TPA: hypothetical protein VGR02_17870 [Thermoanaerobaculia bacterium]|jgi:hypothetical protein|nr:hypothetical protein [Thermoanaerobaculia bacterium]
MAEADPKDVFLNVPFDRSYEPLFVALVGTLVFLNQRPHCVVEIRETGDGRLPRIFELMRACGTSIHDMSRIGRPVRFNMPFELGLAYSLKLANPAAYHVLVLDAQPYRMDRLLSDYKGRDLLIHHNRSAGVVSCLLDSFEKHPVMTAANCRDAIAQLRRSVAMLQRDLQVDSLFRPLLFKALVDNATQIARARGFIAP